MNKLRLIRLAASIGVVCLMQACTIPAIVTKKADAPLPAQFGQGATPSGESAAKIDWTTFFTDANLSALIDTAIANNKEVAITVQRMQMAQNEIQARRGEYLPFVSIGAGAETEKAGEFTRNGAVEQSLEIDEREFPEPLANFDVGLHASWELDVWKKLRNSTKAAALEYMASVEGRNFLITNLVAEVANEYYELMALDNRLANLNQYIQIQRNALGVTRELLNFGRANSLAVKRFEAEVAKNESERYAISQRIVETENHLNLLLGRTPQPIVRASDGLMTQEPALLQTGVPSQLLQRRPDIRQAELELAAADLNISVAKANFYPSFAIRAGVGFEAFRPGRLLEAPESLAYSVVGDVVAPLINRNAITAVYKNAGAAQIEAAYEYEQTIITAFSDVATRVAEIDNLAQSYRLKTSQVEALNASVEVANQLFSSARADYLEVLLAQREALEARNELIETKQKQLSAVVNLYRALGGGWQEEPQAPR
jgi:NodT family efflux transporter outer membrane factor (OMF) lipoprotein